MELPVSKSFPTASVGSPYAGNIFTLTLGEMSDRVYLGFPCSDRSQSLLTPANDSQTVVSSQEPLTMTEITDIPQFLSELPPEFEPLRSLIEANMVPFIKIIEAEIGHALVSRV